MPSAPRWEVDTLRKMRRVLPKLAAAALAVLVLIFLLKPAPVRHFENIEMGDSLQELHRKFPYSYSAYLPRRKGGDASDQQEVKYEEIDDHFTGTLTYFDMDDIWSMDFEIKVKNGHVVGKKSHLFIE